MSLVLFTCAADRRHVAHPQSIIVRCDRPPAVAGKRYFDADEMAYRQQHQGSGKGNKTKHGEDAKDASHRKSILPAKYARSPLQCSPTPGAPRAHFGATSKK